MKELLDKFKEYLVKKKNPYIKTIMKDLDLQEYEVYGLLDLLKRQGYLFDAIEGKIVKIKPVKYNDVYKIPSNLDHLKLLMISDTHLGSKYDRLDILRYLYQEALKLRTDGLAVTLINQIVYGIPEVADKRFKRDVAESMYSTAQENINSLKLQIRIIENQLQREWNNANQSS